MQESAPHAVCIIYRAVDKISLSVAWCLSDGCTSCYTVS